MRGECKVCHGKTVRDSKECSQCKHIEDQEKRKDIRRQYKNLQTSWKEKNLEMAEEAAFDLIMALEDWLGKK